MLSDICSEIAVGHVLHGNSAGFGVPPIILTRREFRDIFWYMATSIVSHVGSRTLGGPGRGDFTTWPKGSRSTMQEAPQEMNSFP
jgi:hypothetical protein